MQQPNLKQRLIDEAKHVDLDSLKGRKDKKVVIISYKKICEMITEIVDRKVSEDKEEIERSIRLEVFASLKSDEGSQTELLLEQRINKMKKTQAALEKALQGVKSGKISAEGISSIYECVQGLDENESDYETKTELLKGIFEQNLTLQKKES